MLGLGLICSYLLTSLLAMLESYLSMFDAQLLCLLALEVMGVVDFVDHFGRVARLAWFEVTHISDSLKLCIIL